MQLIVSLGYRWQLDFTAGASSSVLAPLDSVAAQSCQLVGLCLCVGSGPFGCCFLLVERRNAVLAVFAGFVLLLLSVGQLTAICFDQQFLAECNSF